MLKKKKTWTDYTRLYLNQFRKDNQPDSIGSKILFTKFNETYSNFASDQKDIEFDPRSLNDFDKVENLNRVAIYDWDAFAGGDVFNEWLWDALFYSFGILDVSEFDRKNNIIRPKAQNPYLFYIDPLAVLMNQARYCGRFIYSGYYDLINDGRLDETNIKKMAMRSKSGGYSERIDQNLDKEAKEILLGNNHYYDEPAQTNGYFEILEWYVKNAGKTYVIWVDPRSWLLLGYEELKYNDADDETYSSEFPFIIKNFYKLPRSLMGIGIPDIIEDDHRADVRLKNYMFDGIKIDSIPTFMFNYKALVNPRDLSTREIGKNIATNVTPQGEIVPFPKSGVVNGDTISFGNILENRADLAIGSSRILRASLSDVKKTATEVAVAKSKQDLILASRSKEMNSADKRFWYVWLRRYRQNMSGASKKLVRIVGESGMKELKEFTGKDFVPEVDPDIRVVSSLESEPTKILARRDLGELLPIIQQQGGNVREVIKNMLYMIGKRKDDISNILPPTPHEIRAEEENALINENKVPLIHESDDDVAHISMHMRADDNKVREAHIQAHVLNYLRKANIQTKADQGLETEQNPSNPANPQIGQDLPKDIDEEQQQTLIQGILNPETTPSTPTDAAL